MRIKWPTTYEVLSTTPGTQWRWNNRELGSIASSWSPQPFPMDNRHLVWEREIPRVCWARCGSWSSILEFPASITAWSKDSGLTHDPLAPSLLGYTHARGWERKMFPMDKMAADILTSTFGRPLTSQGHRSDSWLSHFPSSKREKVDGANGYLQPLVTAWEG